MRSQDVSPGILSSLIAQLIRAAQEDNPAEVKVPPDAGTWGPPVAPVSGTSAQCPVKVAPQSTTRLVRDKSVQDHPVPGTEPVMVCFSCGRPGHGVNRCSRVDTSFPFLPLGWSVTIQDGQYRAVWPSGPMARDGPGGRVSTTSGNSGTTDPGGRKHAAWPQETIRLVTGGACAWLQLVSQRTGFPTIGESSAGVFTKGTRAG